MSEENGHLVLILLKGLSTLHALPQVYKHNLYSFYKQPPDGVQLLLEIQEFDQNFTDDFIDRFSVEITNPASSAFERQTYSGIFGLAEIDLSFTSGCAENFYGANCDVFCLENCTIDHCAAVSCGENQRCVNEILNYTCVCQPGYTGTDCATPFEPCTGVNCNSGRCQEGMCVCDAAYTGQFCETQLDGFQLQVTLHSLSNPGGMCAESQCSRIQCCESRACPSFCEYFFSLCLRPAGMKVSTRRLRNQGFCDTIETISSRRIRNGTTFTNSIFGTPNPITLKMTQYVSCMNNKTSCF